MTVDLGMMLDLRDAQVAQEVAERAALGWFDVEFTMYGCAYMKNGERFFVVSALENQINRFVETSIEKGILTSKVHRLTKRCQVPGGMKEHIAIQVKTELAKWLKDNYSGDFFAELERLPDVKSIPEVVSMMKQKQIYLTGKFDANLINDFEALNRYLLRRKCISVACFREYENWIADERKYMMRSAEEKDRFEKTFFGIAYRNNIGNLQYYTNACEEQVYHKQEELLEKGVLVTPVLRRVYYYNNVNIRLQDVKNQFLQTIHQHYSEVFCEELESVLQKSKEEKKAQGRIKLAQVQKTEAEQNTWEFYEKLWQYT